MSQDIRDGAWRLVDFDPASGRSIWHTLGEAGEDVFRVDMPADATIEANKAEFNATMGERFGDWRRIASMPAGHFFETGLAEAARQGDDAFMSRWLNDADNRAFRTFRGVI